MRSVLGGLLIGASLFVAVGQVVGREEIQATNGRFVASYETLNLPKGERMGLLGGGFLYDVRPWLAVGGEAYGAMRGQRGGFITLGLGAEARISLPAGWEANGGCFVGAGGGRGGYQLQGGGLMLRTHAGVSRMFDRIGAFGAGVSWVHFPDGSIHSVQPYLRFDRPFAALLPSGWRDWRPDKSGGAWWGVPEVEQEFSSVYRLDVIPAGVRTDKGAPQHRRLGLLGVEWDRYLGDHAYLRLESEGAMQGNSRGYMQILAGIGYRLPLMDSIWLKASVAAGPAGGGAVDTGGGLLLDARLQLQQRLSARGFATVSAGHARAPGGSFKASSFGMGLGWHFGVPRARMNGRLGAGELADYAPLHMRARMLEQRYIRDHPRWRTHHANLNVDLLGIQLDAFVRDWLYLTGAGIGAWRGKGGGYMTGLVGVGARLPLIRSISVEAEGLLGAAGGGGLDVGGGLVWQATMGLDWRVSEGWSVQARYGWMRSFKGKFRARVATASLVHWFTLPVR